MSTRGPLGALRRALRELLPTTALENLCFIGRNKFEVFCNVQNMTALQYTMNKLRMPVIPNARQKSPHRAPALIRTQKSNRKTCN